VVVAVGLVVLASLEQPALVLVLSGLRPVRKPSASELIHILTMLPANIDLPDVVYLLNEPIVWSVFFAGVFMVARAWLAQTHGG